MNHLAISKELSDYGHELRDWAVAVARPRARQADTDHALPSDMADVLDTAPVPIGRPERDDDVIPSFPDGDLVSRTVYWESLFYGDSLLNEALTRGLGFKVVESIGTTDQVAQWVAPIRDRGGKTGLGMTEPSAGSDPASMISSAVPDGDSWVINGTKTYCSLGAIAEYVVVFAQTEKAAGRSGIRAFVVEKGTPGMVTVKANESKLGLRCWTTSQMAFDDCRVSSSNMVGWDPDPALDRSSAALGAGLASFNDNRPNVSASALGLAQASVDVAKEQLHEQRRSFAPHRWATICAELDQMNAAMDRMRLLNRHAQWLASNNYPNRLEASSAKAYGPPTSERIIRRCMQLLGPQGASEDLLIEKWYRDVKIMDIFEGGGQIMRMLVSRELMGRSAGF